MSCFRHTTSRCRLNVSPAISASSTCLDDCPATGHWGEEPGRLELAALRQDLHHWYFGEEAGGLFLTDDAKIRYLRLQNALAEAVDAGTAPLSEQESKTLRNLASELRTQLGEDIGAANPPRVRSVRPGPTLPPPKPYS